MALAKINDKQYFLDATDSLRPYNILDVKDITSQGFLVKNFGYGWINIENTQPSALSVVEQIDIDKDLNYSSKTRVTESGYYALDHRKEIASKGKESFIKHASEKYDGLFLTQQIEAKSYDANTLPLIYELSKSGKATNSNEISFKPNFDPVYNADDFNDLIRLYSISFPYAFTRTYAMEISIPDGFSVKLPENKSFSTYGGNAAYQYQFKHEGNKVILSINVEMKINEFPAQEYSNLKQLFTELNDKIKENIIIKKLEVRDLIN